MGNPYLLINQVIRTHRFNDWVEAHQENKDDKTMWDYYCFKVGAWDDLSFEDFKKKCKPEPVKPDEEKTITATVGKSFDILQKGGITFD